MTLLVAFEDANWPVAVLNILVEDADIVWLVFLGRGWFV